MAGKESRQSQRVRTRCYQLLQPDWVYSTLGRLYSTSCSCLDIILSIANPGMESRGYRSSIRQQKGQRDVWQDLSDDDRSYAQKALGVEPPERFEFNSMPRKQTEEAPQDLGETPGHLVDLSGAQLRRLLAGYIVLFLFSLGLVASVLLFRFVEVPGLASE